MFSLDGEFIKEFSSIKEGSEFIKRSISHLTSACNGRENSSGGFLWCYEGEEDKIPEKVKKIKKKK